MSIMNSTLAAAMKARETRNVHHYAIIDFGNCNDCFPRLLALDTDDERTYKTIVFDGMKWNFSKFKFICPFTHIDACEEKTLISDIAMKTYGSISLEDVIRKLDEFMKNENIEDITFFKYDHSYAVTHSDEAMLKRYESERMQDMLDSIEKACSAVTTEWDEVNKRARNA